jgi:YfiH family protein
MDWSWTVEEGTYVLRPHPLPPGLSEAGFLGRRLEADAPNPLTDRETVRMPQVHGAEVRWANRPGELAPCDGARTHQPNLVLIVRTAECAPVVLASGVEGIALVHAGWRGVVRGVLEASVASFRHPASLHAMIGPMIGSCCFEVGPEVAERFDSSAVIEFSGSKPHVDLSRAVRSRLGAAGIPDSRIHQYNLCTRCHQHLLHSSRGSNGDPGRMVAFAVSGEGSPDHSHDS